LSDSKESGKDAKEKAQAATPAAAGAPSIVRVKPPKPDPVKVVVKVVADISFPDGVKLAVAFETDLETLLLALLLSELARGCPSPC